MKKVGLEDMQALAVGAITALQEAELTIEAQAIHTRVLSRSPEELLDQINVETGMVWTFKPYVELLMHELCFIASTPQLSPEQRRERVYWTLDIAGF